MDKVKDSKLTISNNTYEAQIPIICPHCGFVIQPIPVANAICLAQNFKIGLVIFQGNCCNRPFSCTYKVESPNASLLQIYPEIKSSPLSEAINEISPRFINLYNQAYSAEQMNHIELAGAGYRNALEVLIKDFAINELKKPKEEVIKKTLAGAIEAYLPSVKLANSADVVRILGNDYTHYERKYDGIDFDVLKSYIEIFIKSIEVEYMVSHPPVPINRLEKAVQD